MEQKRLENAVNLIQSWYSSHCDGVWEHRCGLKIESTDNPGWLVTFSLSNISECDREQITNLLVLRYNLQVTRDNCEMKIFSPSFEKCLMAAGLLAAAGNHGSSSSQAGDARREA